MTSTGHDTMTDGEERTDGEDPGPRVAALRGASVADVNPGRLGRAVVAIVVAAIVVTAVFLVVAGARRNAQVSALHDNGVRVAVTVTGCQGQLGGSGFNFVGYTCRGNYALAGHRYDVTIPGSSFRSAGTKLTLVANPDDPLLVTTVSAAEHSRPSAGVFLVPAALLAVPVGLGVALVLRRRRRRSSARQPSPRVLTAR